MSDHDDLTLEDYRGRLIRLNSERRDHIRDHPELVGQFERIKDTLAHPEFIIVTPADVSVHVYHRFYATTPVTSKYLLVAVKLLENDGFVLTAFFSSRQKKGNRIWQA